MSFENDFACLVCGNKLPTITKELQGYSSYGSGISERTFYDTSADAYFVSVLDQNPFLRPYIQAVNARFVDEEAKLNADVARNVLKAEYREDVLKSRKPILENEAKLLIDNFSEFASEFARPFENCIYQPAFVVHGEPECIDKIMEISGKTTVKKRIVEEGKPDKMLVGEIVLDVETALSARGTVGVFPKLTAYFEPLDVYMKREKENMLLEFMHFSEFKK